MHLGTLYCAHCGHAHRFTVERQPERNPCRCEACGKGLRNHSRWEPWQPDPADLIQVTPEMAEQSAVGPGRWRCAVTGGDAEVHYSCFALSRETQLRAYAWVWSWRGYVVEGPDADLDAVHERYIRELEKELRFYQPGSWDHDYTTRMIAEIRAGKRFGEIRRENCWEILTKPPYIAPTKEEFAHLLPERVGRVAPGKDYFTFDGTRESWLFPMLEDGDRLIPLHPAGAYGVCTGGCVGGGESLNTYDVLVDLAARDLGFQNPRVIVVGLEYVADRLEICAEAEAALKAGLTPDGRPALVNRTGRGREVLSAYELDGEDLSREDLKRIAAVVWDGDFWTRMEELRNEPLRVDPDLYAHASQYREPTPVPGVLRVPVASLRPLSERADSPATEEKSSSQ